MARSENEMRRLALILLTGLILLVLAGCRGGKPTPEPTSASAASGSPEELPSSPGSAVIRPTEGGIVILSGGAEVAVPRGSLSDDTVVSLRVANTPPGAPVPRSAMGPTYELSLDGGDLTGVAVVKLPLPPNITAEEYDLAAYRWNGRTWERVGGRLTDRSIQFGTRTPGLFTLQGVWKLASAALALTSPTAEMPPGQQTVPISVSGQYRFSSLPTLQRGYLPIRLLLKLDSSGGAGQITGDVSLDQTVAETQLWLQPDANQAQGEIPFTHIFELSPGDLGIAPADIGRLYAVLTVEDSEAPTRQLSTAIDYKQVLPIKAVDAQIVRPTLANEGAVPLRWHIRLNGQTLLQIPAVQAVLSLDEVLAKGGLGEYRIALEAESEGNWVLASNEVSVTLAPPETPTPAQSETPAPGATQAAGAIAVIQSPTPAGPPPPTPTRRTPPIRTTEEPTPESSPTGAALSPTPAATPTRPAWAQTFWADRYSLASGECTILHWNVQNVTAVYLDKAPVTGNETRRVCPDKTTTYALRVVSDSGTQDRYVTIYVGSAAQPVLTFTADKYEIVSGNCTMLYWQVTDVRSVYLNDEGVAGEASKEICPQATTTYTLRVIGADGTTSTKSLTVAVVPTDKIVMRFWADQYTMSPGTCTYLHWSVKDVEAVYVGETDHEDGVPGESMLKVCPTGRQSYTLRATASDDRSDTRNLILDAQEPSLGANEVIAQGVVREVTRVNDADPDNSGDQPGWHILVDGLNPLFTGSNDCCQAAVTLEVPQDLIDQQVILRTPVDWPINPEQLVEFRGACTDNTCSLQTGSEPYLRLRSE